METLTVVPNRTEAEMLCGMLRANGIACSYEQGNFGATTGDAAQGGSQRIVVASRRDAEQARRLIASSHGQSLGGHRFAAGSDAALPTGTGQIHVSAAAADEESADRSQATISKLLVVIGCVWIGWAWVNAAKNGFSASSENLAVISTVVWSVIVA